MECNKDILEIAHLHQNLNNLVSCPICLDLLISPVRTKCGHVFCRSCIEDHIQKSKRTKQCPLCNTPKLTKRSLEVDDVMMQLVKLVKELKEAENEDTNNEVNFLQIRINRVEARESNGSPHRAVGESKWTPVKSKPANVSTRKDIWHQNKKRNVRTYTKPKPTLDREPSLEFPGEFVEGLSIKERNSPVIPMVEKTEMIGDWLKADKSLSGEMMDFSSQPESVRGESTPQAEGSRENNNLSKFAKMATPLITPVRKKRTVPTGTKMGRKRSSLEKIDTVKNLDACKKKNNANDKEPPLAVEPSTSENPEDFPTISQAVDINNTFDKLIAHGRKELQRFEENPNQYEDQNFSAELFFSQPGLKECGDTATPDLSKSQEDLKDGQEDEEKKVITISSDKEKIGGENKAREETEDIWDGRSLSEMLEEGIQEKIKKAPIGTESAISKENIESCAERVSEETLSIHENLNSVKKMETDSFPSVISPSAPTGDGEHEINGLLGRRSFMLDIDSQDLKMSAEPQSTLDLIVDVAKMESSAKSGLSATETEKKSKLSKKKSPLRKSKGSYTPRSTRSIGSMFNKEAATKKQDTEAPTISRKGLRSEHESIQDSENDQQRRLAQEIKKNQQAVNDNSAIGKNVNLIEALKSNKSPSKDQQLIRADKRPLRISNEGNQKEGHRVKFSILGRVRANQKKILREKVVRIYQLGLLTPIKTGLPSLKDLIHKKRAHHIHQMECCFSDQHKVDICGNAIDLLENVPSWELSVEKDDLPLTKEKEDQNMLIPCDEDNISIPPKSGSELNLLQRHLSEVDDDDIKRILNRNKDQLNQTNSIQIEEASPQNLTQDDFEHDLPDIPLEIYDMEEFQSQDKKIGNYQVQPTNALELPTPEKKQDFMTDLLGKNMSDVYSQDKETRSQETSRLALQEFLTETEDLVQASCESNMSFSSAKEEEPLNDTSSIEFFKDPKRRRINVIESDEDSNEMVIDENVSPQKAKIKLVDELVIGGNNGFENSFKDLNETEDIQDSQASDDGKKRITRRHYKLRSPLVDIKQVNKQNSATGKNSTTEEKCCFEQSTQENLQRSIGVLSSPHQTQEGRTSQNESSGKVEDREKENLHVDSKKKDTLDSDEDMFSATPDDIVKRNINKMKGLKEPGLSTVYENIESEEQKVKGLIRKHPLNVSNVEVPETEDLRLVEVDDMFKEGTQVSEENGLISQVISSKKPLSTAGYDVSRWKFVLSNLSNQNRATVSKFVSMFNCPEICASVDDQTTHVIVKTEDNLYAQRTLKYLQGVCRGLMIVSSIWCEQSVELGVIQDPLKFEVLDMELGGENGPFRSRTSKLDGKKPILNDWEILVMGDVPTIPRPSLENMISFLGARNVRDTKEFSSSPKCQKIVLVDSISEVTLKQARRLMKSLKLGVVDKEWLLETIGGWKIRELLPHSVEGLRAEELLACGYPSSILGHL